MYDNRLDFSQPASIALTPTPAGSIVIPVAAIAVFGFCMIAAFKTGEESGRRQRR